jgi:Asp-tRNA(Asn)/Glu-tRNA(Gln) amidotransferase A subunit family amidase
VDFRHDGLVDLARQIRGGEVSATEVVQGSLDRIEEFDGRVRAFVAIDPRRSAAEAAEIDRRLAGGRTGRAGDGMPVGLQVVGRQLDDLGVLQALHAFEPILASDRQAPLG